MHVYVETPFVGMNSSNLTTIPSNGDAGHSYGKSVQSHLISGLVTYSNSATPIRKMHTREHTHIHIHSHMYLVLGCSFNSMHFNMHINEPDICTDATDTINREDINQLHLSERCHVKFTDQKRDFLPNTWWIWVFPKIGLPLVIIHFSGIFPYKNHPAMGVPPFQETSI